MTEPTVAECLEEARRQLNEDFLQRGWQAVRWTIQPESGVIEGRFDHGKLYGTMQMQDELWTYKTPCGVGAVVATAKTARRAMYIGNYRAEFAQDIAVRADGERVTWLDREGRSPR